MTRLQQLTKDLLELERKLVNNERERKKLLEANEKERKKLLDAKIRLEAAIEKEKQKPK